MNFNSSMRKRRAVKDAEASGEVADSKEVRMQLVSRMNAGEITLEEMQAELAAIKRSAKKNGQVTRAQAFRNG